MSSAESINKYLVDLENDDIQVRNMARRQLANIGPEAVPDLINQLKTDKQRCRWEAAKILGDIRDESAAEALVEALLDDSISVHWVATEALIKYGQSAILPVLEGITRHFDSMRFRQGAYHILHVFESSQRLEPKVQEVLDALRDIEPSVSAPWAAERAIEEMLYGKK
jgi:HEAT repeat protein